MNCWIVLLLLCCCGKNNTCIQPRMCDRECDYEEVKPIQPRNDGCGCAGEERGREKWMPYSECSDNERRDCNCR